MEDLGSAPIHRTGLRRRSARRLATPRRGRTTILALLLLTFLTGCTSPGEYIRNGFKVGPNYGPPPVPVAEDWIDANDLRRRDDEAELSQWWKVFNDPVLDGLICDAYRQNITLREAGFRVMQARAVRGIAVGELFPQTQDVSGSYTRNAISIAGFALGGRVPIARYFNQFDLNFGMMWELDFWGRFRRAVEAADADLNASVEEYDDVLVTLLGDIATNYVQFRTLQQQIDLARENIRLQRESVRIANAKFEAGRTTELDVSQARSTLAQTEALVPLQQTQLRQVSNRLCVLLGIAPEELERKLGKAPIPSPPSEAAIGIPADLVRRRPDVRRAERLAAAQSARIGIAESEFYPHITILGEFGWQARDLDRLFTSEAFQGRIGPSFRWNLLNYGRILNDVRRQDARFQEAIAAYQNSVLTAAEEVENGLVLFQKAQERVTFLRTSVKEAEKAVKIAVQQFEVGTVDFNRVTVLQQALVQQQDLLAQARGDVTLGLVQVYRALGGGWQIRETGCDDVSPLATPVPQAPDAAAPRMPRADAEPETEENRSVPESPSKNDSPKP